MKHIKFQRIELRKHAELTERWLQDCIADDPQQLGLGDLVLKDKERIQPRAGRLDLLFQHADRNERYEVEIQLGPTDESHLIRTIEYWDIERKRYPQYDHTAVIIAEEITARFLNVISLFAGSIPLVAIQLTAQAVDDSVGLVFTRVVDHIKRGLVDEDEEVAEITDRAYWEERGSRKTLCLVDELLQIAKTCDRSLELKYNKFYIGLATAGAPNNFAIFRPKKGFLRLEPRLPQTPETTERFEAAGLDVMDYDERWGRYRIRLQPGDVEKHRPVLQAMVIEAHRHSTSE